MVEKKETEMTPATPHERLKLARKRWQVANFGKVGSASEAADVLSIPKGTYLGLENGTRSIIAGRAQQLASRFRVPGVTPEWILYGRGADLLQPVKKMSQSIAICYASDISAFSAISCGSYLESERRIEVGLRVGNGKKERRLVGVETEDDAMARDKTPSFGAGVIIIFDADQTPKPGSVVWAHIASRDEIVVREYTRVMSAEPGAPPSILLRAYNPSYESIPFDEAAGDKIGGVFDPQAARLAVYMQA